MEKAPEPWHARIRRAAPLRKVGIYILILCKKLIHAKPQSRSASFGMRRASVPALGSPYALHQGSGLPQEASGRPRRLTSPHSARRPSKGYSSNPGFTPRYGWPRAGTWRGGFVVAFGCARCLVGVSPRTARLQRQEPGSRAPSTCRRRAGGGASGPGLWVATGGLSAKPGGVAYIEHAFLFSRAFQPNPSACVLAA
jgi:hypothetical protein